MAIRLSTDIKRRIDLIVDDVTRVYVRAKAAYHNGTWSYHHRDALTRRHDLISEWLAHCSDGRYYGLVEADILGGMRSFITEAEALLMAAPQPKHGLIDVASSEPVRLKWGWHTQWAMSRELTINGKTFEHAVVVTNPASGRRQLDQWEQDLLATELFNIVPSIRAA